MNWLKVFAFCLFTVLGLSQKEIVQGQSVSSVSSTGHIFAEIIQVYSATEATQMNFGRFAPGPYGGKLFLTPESTISVQGSVYAGQGMHTAASFNIFGDNNASFTITLPTEPVTIKHVSGQMTMVVEKLISNPDTGIGAGVLRNGTSTVYIGGVLKVGTLEDNPAGVYTGNYFITFDFN